MKYLITNVTWIQHIHPNFLNLLTKIKYGINFRLSYLFIGLIILFGFGITGVGFSLPEATFHLPNTEYRNNGYRLITANTTEEVDNKEIKMSLRQLRRDRIYAYVTPEGRLVDYHSDRNLYYRMKQQYAGNSEYEVFNRRLLQAAQQLITDMINGEPACLAHTSWGILETAVILTLYRVMLKYETNSSNPDYRTTFMDQLRIQDYEIMDEETMIHEFPDHDFSWSKRAKLILAALGGLENSDPRVRLQCIHFLRRLGPDATMLEEVSKHRRDPSEFNEQAYILAAIGSETAHSESIFIDTNLYQRANGAMQGEMIYRYEGIEPPSLDNPNEMIQIWRPALDYNWEEYEYQRGFDSMLESDPNSGRPMHMNHFGMYQLKSPTEELDKLFKFCMRDYLVYQIQEGMLATITHLTNFQLNVLSQSIDQEFILDIPLASFHSEFLDQPAPMTIHTIQGDSVDVTEIISQNTGLPSKYAVFKPSDISVIKMGIQNNNFLVQKACAGFLIRFYNSYPGLSAQVKFEIQDALFYYKQLDIAIEEVILVFQGEEPNGRCIIKVGTRLAKEMNSGGVRIYASLPPGIRKDIRNAIIESEASFPRGLLNILGMVKNRTPW